MSYVLGVGSFKGKELALVAGEVEAMVTPSMLGLGDDFYGGSVKQMARIEPGVYYCIDRNNLLPKDVYISDLRELKYDSLREVAKIKGIKFPHVIKKVDLLELMGVKKEEPVVIAPPKVEEEDPLDLDNYDPETDLKEVITEDQED